MAYSRTFTQTTSFSSVNGKSKSAENIYVMETDGNKTGFLKKVSRNDKTRSLIGFTPDGIRMAIVSQKKNGDKVKVKNFLVDNPKNLKKTISNSLNMENIESNLGINENKPMKNKRQKKSRTGKKTKESKKTKVGKKTKEGKRTKAGKKTKVGKKIKVAKTGKKPLKIKRGEKTKRAKK